MVHEIFLDSSNSGITNGSTFITYGEWGNLHTGETMFL